MEVLILHYTQWYSGIRLKRFAFSCQNSKMKIINTEAFLLLPYYTTIAEFFCLLKNSWLSARHTSQYGWVNDLPVGSALLFASKVKQSENVQSASMQGCPHHTSLTHTLSCHLGKAIFTTDIYTCTTTELTPRGVSPWWLVTTGMHAQLLLYLTLSVVTYNSLKSSGHRITSPGVR